jgi:hypothetical protein
MTENFWLTIFGIVFTLIQTLSIFILTSIKSDQKEIKNDQKEIWKRIYNHYHEIACTNEDCKKVKTGNVIIPHEAS